jgi:hypothetical protein
MLHLISVRPRAKRDNYFYFFTRPHEHFDGFAGEDRFEAECLRRSTCTDPSAHQPDRPVVNAMMQAALMLLQEYKSMDMTSRPG